MTCRLELESHRSIAAIAPVLAGPVPHQLGAASYEGRLPVRLSRPLASAHASSSSLILAVCYWRFFANRSSSPVRW